MYRDMKKRKKQFPSDFVENPMAGLVWRWPWFPFFLFSWPCRTREVFLKVTWKNRERCHWWLYQQETRLNGVVKTWKRGGENTRIEQNITNELGNLKHMSFKLGPSFSEVRHDLQFFFVSDLHILYDHLNTLHI